MSAGPGTLTGGDQPDRHSWTFSGTSTTSRVSIRGSWNTGRVPCVRQTSSNTLDITWVITIGHRVWPGRGYYGTQSQAYPCFKTTAPHHSRKNNKNHLYSTRSPCFHGDILLFQLSSNEGNRLEEGGPRDAESPEPPSSGSESTAFPYQGGHDHDFHFTPTTSPQLVTSSYPSLFSLIQVMSSSTAKSFAIVPLTVHAKSVSTTANAPVEVEAGPSTRSERIVPVGQVEPATVRHASARAASQGQIVNLIQVKPSYRNIQNTTFPGASTSPELYPVRPPPPSRASLVHPAGSHRHQPSRLISCPPRLFSALSPPISPPGISPLPCPHPPHPFGK